MESFEELGVSPELVETLASEGIEAPTPLQEAAVPVLSRGNNLLVAAGPGAGTLVAWGVALLHRVAVESSGPRALVLTSTAEVARALAESLQRLATGTGHAVAALESPWALPGRAHIVFGTPGAVLSAARSGEIDLGDVHTLVVDQADRIEGLCGLAPVEEVLGFLPRDDGQRIVTSLPVTPAVEDFVERHARRSLTVPSPPDRESAASPRRGTLRYRVVREPKEEAVLEAVAEVLATDARHVLLYCRGEDGAADLGDYLTLHGYAAGSPGDARVPVWLGVHELDSRASAEGVDGVVVVSCDVPAGPDSLDRRHGRAGGGWVLILPREVAHLRDVARRTGYGLEPAPRAPRTGDEGTRFRELVARAIEEEDISPYLVLLEPLFERFDAAEVAAAAAALLRRKIPPPPLPAPAGATEGGGRSTPKAWVRVFLSVGERDGLTPKDLLGAITGEADVAGAVVGKIEIRESHSLVEVQDSVAQQVITALNGTTIRGRAVRADFDRPRPRSSGPRGTAGRGRGPRRV